MRDVWIRAIRKGAVVLGIFLVLSGCTASPSATDQPINTSPYDHRRYDVTTLTNGLQVVLVSDPKSLVSGASLTVGAGYLQDPPEQQGLAHFTEHMLFLGTENFPGAEDYRSFINRYGGVTNGFTSAERTMYFLAIPSRVYDEALARFSDRFEKPLLSAEYTQRELAAVDHEWSMKAQLDPVIERRILALLLNPEHPASRFGAGNKSTLGDKTGSILHSEVLAFYRTYYAPSNMKLVLYGSEGLEELAAKAERHFGDVPKLDMPTTEVQVPAFIPGLKAQHVHYEPKQLQHKLNLMFPLVDNTHHWRFKPNEYLQWLLNRSAAGGLIQQLRSRGLARSVQASLAPVAFGNSGVANLEFALTEEGYRQKDEVIAATLAYLDFLKGEGESHELFDEFKAEAERSFASSHSLDVIPRINGISSALFDYPARHILDAEAEIEAYRPALLRDVLDQLRADSMLVWHTGPREPVDTDLEHYPGRYSVRPVPDEQLARWQQKKLEWRFQWDQAQGETGGDPAYRAERTFLLPQKVVDSKDAEAVLIHDRNAHSNWGFLQLRLDSDIGRQSAKNFVLASMLNDLYILANPALFEQFAAQRVQLKFGHTPQYTPYFEIHGPTHLHQLVLERALTSFSQLSFEESNFQQLRQRFENWVHGLDKLEPLAAANRALERVIRPEPWDREALLEAAGQIDTADLFGYHRTLMQEHFLRLFAAGNYSEGMVVELVESARSVFNERRRGEPHPTPKIVLSSGQAVSVKRSTGHTDNAYIRAYVAPQPSPSTAAHVAIISTLMASTLFEQLRTQEAMAYNLGAGLRMFDYRPALVMNIQSNNTSLPAIKQRFDRFEREFLAALAAWPADELEHFKRDLLNYRQQTTDLWVEVELYLQDWQQGDYDRNTQQQLNDAVTKTTVDDLVQTYRQLVLDRESAFVEVEVQGQSSGLSE